jgi:hypothetical protein
MVSKTEVEKALKQAGVEVIDEIPGGRGGWIFNVAGMNSGHYSGKAEAVVAGLKCAEELERLCKHFIETKK